MNIKNFNWGSSIFIIGYHLLLFSLLPLYFLFFTPSVPLIIFSVVLFFCSGISITAGYHRFYSHKSYKITNKFVEGILLFFGSMATQGSALRWSSDHRLHHAHIDSEDDPYSVKKGFWYAHILWMFEKQNPIDNKAVADLHKNKLVMFQHRFYEICMVVANVIPVLIAGWLWGDFFGAFLFVWLFRMFLLHHSTWFINSLAHYWGHQNYSREHSAVDNYILCMLTFGEGYHNYHHTFANDYRNGIRWYHFDPTKWLIWTLSKLGLVKDLRKTQEARINRQLIINHKNELLEKLKNSLYSKKQEMEKKVSDCADALMFKLGQMSKLLSSYKEFKQKKLQGSEEKVKILYQEIKRLKKSLKEDWRRLDFLTKNIMKLKPAFAI